MLPFGLWSHLFSRNKVRNKGRRRLPIQAVPEGTGVPCAWGCGACRGWCQNSTLIKHQHSLETSWLNKMGVEPVWMLSLLLRNKDAQNRQWESTRQAGGGPDSQDLGPFIHHQLCQRHFSFRSSYIYTKFSHSKFWFSLYTIQQNVFQNTNKNL